MIRWTEAAVAQNRLNLEGVLFEHYKLPRLEVLAQFKDRTLWRATGEFLERIIIHPRFIPWNLVSNHGVTARRGWREDVPRYSVQAIQHGALDEGDCFIEADIDRANPDYGLYYAILHLGMDVMKFGKADPFTIRKGLLKRGIYVPRVEDVNA